MSGSAPATASVMGRGPAITERVLDAATAVLIEGGWGALTPKAAARAAGVSQRAVQNRFPTRSELAAAVTGRVLPPLRDSLAGLLDAGGLLDAKARPADLARGLDDLASPDAARTAAVELVIVSRFDTQVHQAVHSALGAGAAEWCTPYRGVVSAALAARRAYLLIIGLGLVITAASAPRRLRLDGETVRVAAALADARRPVSLPRAEARHLRHRPVLAPDDPALEALLRAALDQVGERGFDDMTTAGIARAAGYSEGLLFSRYPSKLDLFLDACEIQRRPGFQANEEFLARITASRGRGVAEAVLLRESMHPDAEGPRTLTLEQVRVSWHDERLRASLASQADDFVASLRESPLAVPAGRDPRAYFHMATAVGSGMVLLPRLVPDAWQLPFDVMTIPLEDG